MIMFHSPDEFTGLSELAAGWTAVRDELDDLSRNAFMKWPETSIYDGDWTVFPLFKVGTKVEANCLLCPQTTRRLEAIPGMITAGFSSLAPGTYIGPHHGYTNEVLRCHLGLKPAEHCGIRVGTETRQWIPGSCFVFDDTIEHEAWNRGKETRVVLLLDFKRDPTREVVFPDAVYEY